MRTSRLGAERNVEQLKDSLNHVLRTSCLGAERNPIRYNSMRWMCFANLLFGSRAKRAVTNSFFRVAFCEPPVWEQSETDDHSFKKGNRVLQTSCLGAERNWVRLVKATKAVLRTSCLGAERNARVSSDFANFLFGSRAKLGVVETLNHLCFANLLFGSRAKRAGFF